MHWTVVAIVTHCPRQGRGRRPEAGWGGGYKYPLYQV
jgi:hypothetical protein